MYGTIARLRVKPGMESQLLDQARQEDALNIPGFIGEYVYRMDQDSNEYYLVVLFDSKESYFANANSPEQDARYRQMLDLLQAEPEWHDGEVVHSFIAAGAPTAHRFGS